MLATDTTSALQAAALQPSDPSGGRTFFATTTPAQALGLGNFSATDGSIGIDSSTRWAWSRNNIAAGTQDAVGTSGCHGADAGVPALEFTAN